MEIDHIYFVYKNGVIYTDVPASEIEMREDRFVFSDFCEYESQLNYDEIYAIGIMTEDGCEVLWKAE